MASILALGLLLLRICRSKMIIISMFTIEIILSICFAFAECSYLDSFSALDFNCEQPVASLDSLQFVVIIFTMNCHLKEASRIMLIKTQMMELNIRWFVD